MNKQQISNRQSVLNGILYGTASMFAIRVSGLLLLDGDTKYTGSLTTTALTFGILVCAILLCSARVQKYRKKNDRFTGKLALSAIFFSLSVGLTAGLIHYVDATFIDPDYAQNALNASQATWTARNYSKEAIAAQIELTDTFKRPWKWALTSACFMIILTLLLFVPVSWFSKLIYNQDKSSGIA